MPNTPRNHNSHLKNWLNRRDELDQLHDEYLSNSDDIKAIQNSKDLDSGESWYKHQVRGHKLIKKPYQFTPIQSNNINLLLCELLLREIKKITGEKKFIRSFISSEDSKSCSLSVRVTFNEDI